MQRIARRSPFTGSVAPLRLCYLESNAPAPLATARGVEGWIRANMAERSTSPKPRTFRERLRGLRWFGSFNPNASTFERDALTVLDALSKGDDLLVRSLAKLIEDRRERLDKADDLGVREHWFTELAEWDGREPTALDMADRFVNAMAAFLSRYEGQGEFYVDTQERAEAVRLAFERTRASRFYERNPGRSLLSAGLKAMGISREEIDDMLDVFAKR
jgi:hypothetical protein